MDHTPQVRYLEARECECRELWSSNNRPVSRLSRKPQLCTVHTAPLSSRTREPDILRNHSSSLLSSPSPFFAVFFFFFLFFPAFLERGCSRSCKISSSVIFLSDLYCDTSRAGGAARRVRPFLVIAKERVSASFAYYQHAESTEKWQISIAERKIESLVRKRKKGK
jgi:hypothetical protein